MKLRNIVRFSLLFALLVLGVWALSGASGPGPETAARQQAVRAAAAPAGTVADSVAVAPAEYGPINPVSVSMMEAAANSVPVDSQYDKWLRGEIDLDELDEGRVSAAERAALMEEALGLPASENVQNAAEAAGSAPDPAGVAFDALDATECCGGSGGVVPPDSEMSAGPNHLIAVVNLALEIYDKSGTSLVGPTTLSSFFGPLGGACASGPFDPTTVYDEEEDRFAIAADGDGTHYCIGVSATSDPTGSWNLYAVPAQPVGGEFHDYPHTGVGDEYIVVGANQFGGAIPGGFEGRVWALDKSDMYSGSALTPISFSTTIDYGTPQPLDLHGYAQGTWPSLGSTHYFVTDFYDGCTIQVWEWAIPAAPTIANTIDLCVATGVTGGFPLDAPQMGGGALQANDWRNRGFEYRNGSGWVTDSISCATPTGAMVDCVRWEEIDLTVPAPALVQAGVYAGTGEFRTFPDLAVNHCGDMAIGYTKTSSSMFAGLWYTGRESGDPLGTLQAEAELKAGEATYVAFDGAPYRWGDYSGMTIDPDGTTFWFMGEYTKDIGGSPPANWGNYIGSFEYPDCAPAQQEICSTPALSIPDNLPSGVSDTISTVDASTITDLNVYLDTTHSWIGDLLFTLEHVDTGTTVDFFDRPGVPASTFGCSGNDIDATINDEGVDGNVEDECDAGVPTIFGDFVGGDPPSTSLLAAFDGETLAGDWTLTVSDNAGGDTGVLNEWCIVLETTGGDAPDIFVDPLAIASTQNANTVTNWPLDIENVGTADLDWDIDEDNSVAHPISEGVVPPANRVTIGDGPAAFGGSGLTGPAIQTERETPAGLTTITHSASQSIVPGNSVSCNNGIGHTDNSYLRIFDLESFGITGAFDVVEVEIGIESATGPGGMQPATMNLYLWDDADPFTFANLTPIGSAGVTVFDGDSGTVITVPVAGSAPAGSNLVVEFFTPDGQATSTLMWVGSNPSGQTAPTYLAAADCGVPEPTDTAALGFPGMHLVMNVTGDTDAGPAACDAPEDIPWASVAPTGGTTAPGNTDTATVTFDSTGLAAGTYTGALCVTSNDPDPGPGNGTDLVIVDLELTVEVPTDVSLSGISGDTNAAMLPLALTMLLGLMLGFGLLLRRRSVGA